MTDQDIRLATDADADRVATLIAEAFQPLEVTAWLVADPDLRAQVLAANFRIYVDHALKHGEIHILGDVRSVAIWFPQDRGPVPEPDDYRARLAAACGEYTDRFRSLDEAFADHHPHNFPHHHLALLATRPAEQRIGLGTALLLYHHSRLDALEIPAFVEASSTRSRALYARHGYEPLDDPYHLPDGGPPMWPMWREPMLR